MKYAENYVQIFLEADSTGGKDEFYVRTVNDGLIVPDTMKEEIFKPFVRFNGNENGRNVAGTGIGLSLSRSLAELHRGSLRMAEGEKANVFFLTLPTIQDNAIIMDSEIAGDIATSAEPRARWEEHEKSSEGRYTVLVVEDNPEMLSFISRQLSHGYIVLTATNGEEALHVLDNNFVNLVVSDVVMPLMDGFELCKTIKSELDYSHIPIILLTAKTNIRSKVEGLELGADAYIEKPFSPEYLQAAVSNLVKNRENLWQAFAKSPFVAANTMALTKADEEFIRKMDEIILSNLHNPEFSMEDMAKMFNMSRSGFYRKIKGVLDLTPNDYLRIERLKRAAQLLKSGENRVNEVCYMVGFNSSSYFSKCFLKQFGVLPRDFNN
jgi:DNA-binding response OmpR family regulator